jgi:hypothetical protein
MKYLSYFIRIHLILCTSQFNLYYTININENDFFSKLTFADLLQQNVKSEELYLWLAPIDIIEDYQFYLNQLSTENDLSLGETVFFNNCTLPRFGPMRQY